MLVFPSVAMTVTVPEMSVFCPVADTTTERPELLTVARKLLLLTLTIE